MKRHQETSQKVHLFNKAEWDNPRTQISSFCEDYTQSCSSLSVNEKWCTFKDKLTSLIDQFVPHKFTSSRYSLPWMTTAMKRLSRKKHRQYNKARKTHSKNRDTVNAPYKSRKAQFNTGMKQVKDRYVCNIISSAFDDNNTKPFFKFIKSKRHDNTGIAPLKNQRRLHSHSQSKADILNNQFTSLFNIEDSSDIP